jgi:hypothetical protein
MAAPARVHNPSAIDDNDRLSMGRYCAVYELILEEKLATALATLLLAVVVSAAVGAGRLWFRGLLYSLAPAMAAAFYAVAFLAEPHPNTMDLLSGLLFETSVLALFFWLLVRLIRDLETIDPIEARRVLKWSLLLQLLFALPNMTTGGYGLFSEGSRIEYLYSGSLPKYFTYASMLTTGVQTAFLAALVSGTGRLGVIGWMVILTNFALSVVAGSKGGVFLWLIAVASLIDYRRARIPGYKLLGVTLIVACAVMVSSMIVAEFLGLDLDVFLELALNRFFLNNDARALALDLRNSQSAGFSLFSEGFRSLGNLFGLPPRNDPLGVLLYSEGLSITNGNGANASFMALATYYFPDGYAMVPATFGMVGAVVVVVLIQLSVGLSRTRASRVVITSICLMSLLIYSQDFLAFQVVLPLAVLAVLACWIFRSKLHDTAFRLQHRRG